MPSAALLVELLAGLEHPEASAVDVLFDRAGGLRKAMAETFDAEHRAAVERVLHAAGRVVRPEEQESAEPDADADKDDVPVSSVRAVAGVSVSVEPLHAAA